MKRRLRYHEDFRADLRKQLAWLADQREPAWIEGLRDGLEEAAALLLGHPGAGTLEGREHGGEIRRLVLRRVPYLVWYGVDARGDLWFVRLFHARQAASMPSWPPVRPRRTKK